MPVMVGIAKEMEQLCPNALFINPPGYGVRFGSLGSNVFRGPWFNGLDSALMKNFKVREAVTLQVRRSAQPAQPPELRRHRDQPEFE